MSNLTIAVDDGVIKQARIRAIQEGTSVSARLREYLAAYAAGKVEPLTTAEEQPRFAASPSVGTPPLPAWLQTLRARVEAFGGLEPEEWLEPRDRSGPRPVDLDA